MLGQSVILVLRLGLVWRYRRHRPPTVQQLALLLVLVAAVAGQRVNAWPRLMWLAVAAALLVAQSLWLMALLDSRVAAISVAQRLAPTIAGKQSSDAGPEVDDLCRQRSGPN